MTASPTTGGKGASTGGKGGNDGAIDLRAELRAGAEALGKAPAGDARKGVTSDLSIDETILLHSMGWEAVDLVFGVSIQSVPYGVWQWSQGEVSAAGAAHTAAVQAAAHQMRNQCHRAGGFGVVGVHPDIEVRPHHISVELVGTAVRPVGAKPHGTDLPFVSDLSARDFTMLARAGWVPVGLAFGTSFVNAPRRSAGTVLQQRSQNVELTNLTEAMYAARESAMERMQSDALRLGATGVVGVAINEGPMPFARHVIRFSSQGTAVRLDEEAHRGIEPQVVLSMDDVQVMFEAGAVRTGPVG